VDAIVNGVKLHYEVHGRGSSVLFIHGFPLSGELWQACIEPMKNDYRLIIPDLRGHGQSEASEQASMGRYADDLRALLDEVGERNPVVVVGHSMGGYVAFEFFRRYPELVQGLVLVNTRAVPDTEEGRQDRYDTAERVRREGSQVVAESMSKKLFAPGAPTDLVNHWREVMAATPPEGVAAALNAMAERPDSTETLEDFSRPLLILAGEEDTITPPADAEAMSELAAGSELLVISGAGHMLPVEQPQQFIAQLEQFLDSMSDPDVHGSWTRWG
jgi:pimeloyl-ACP methyl ester carboxylesterase